MEPVGGGANRLFKLFGHAEVLLQVGERFGRPLLELGVISAFRILGEQFYSFLMGAYLHLVVSGIKFLAGKLLEFIQLFLVLGIERGGNFSLYLAGLNEGF